MERSDVVRALERPGSRLVFRLTVPFISSSRFDTIPRSKPSPGEHGETERNLRFAHSNGNPTNTDAANMPYCRAPCEMKKADECQRADDDDERPLSRTNNSTGAPLADSLASFDSHAGYPLRASLIVPAACDTINPYGAQTFREPTT
jgi:hypothetical protein